MEAKPGVDFYVDEKYLPFVSKFVWRADRKYFYTSIGGKKIYLHRLIFGFFGNFQVDHADNNRTNNNLDNLRPANRSQNMANALMKRAKSPYRGVSQRKDNGRWTANAWLYGKRYRRTFFKTPEDAARQYDKWAKELWGEYAILNFPEFK